MPNIEKLTEKIINFRKARDWKQFHKPKDIAISLSLEASEVLEHFQWKSNEEIEKYVKENKEEIGEELADVMYWVLLMSHDLKINILSALEKKMKKNEKKYPVEKAKGKHTKYNKLK
jgi:NTP pyrophosphatase (non-canonical NTP hydrolase)